MKRLLGLDVGDKTIGIAVSDELGLTAQGVMVRTRQGLAADVASLRELVEHYGAAGVVVGLPKNMDGSIGPQARKTLAFIARLRQACSVPVVEWDERLTTQQAERVLLAADASRRRRKQVRDQLAAQLILQTYLEWQGRQESMSTHHTQHPRPSEASLTPENDSAAEQDDSMRKPYSEQ
jgi:putative holliday junction resolvase